MSRLLETCFVTGAVGFIGSTFCRHRLETSSCVLTGYDKLTYAANPLTLDALQKYPRFSFIQGDVCVQQQLATALHAARPKLIVHFAVETHVDRSIETPDAFVKTNVLGTQCLLQASYDYWKNLPEQDKADFLFLHISTDEVFGTLTDKDTAFTETSPYAPSSPYAASKAAADHLVRAFHKTYGLPTIISHCSNNYGPYQFPEKLIPHMILRALQGENLPLYGDGQNARDWLYVEDHVSALELIAQKGTAGKSYTIGRATSLTNYDLTCNLCDILDELAPAPSGKSYKEKIVFVTDRPGHDKRYALKPSAFLAEQGWRCTRNLKEGLRETVQWYLANKDWCRLLQEQGYTPTRRGLTT